MDVEAVIGLEVHVQLATRTKMFCADGYEFGAEPNSRVCPVCLGLPGALPTVNGAAVDLAVRAALALGCEVLPRSGFARKNYFYPDLPKGYQITQYDRPLATGGWLDVPVDGDRTKRVRIRRLHIEEDAGKLLHDRFEGRTAVDLNRAGVPLIEVVSEPELETAAQARKYLVRLKRTFEYLGVSDCDMEKGSLRVDANVSVRRPGSGELGTKTEVKNLNSFANVERALSFEIGRQADLVLGGGRVVHETLLWDAERGVARSMRGKEESHDYRYLPEPDLPPLVLDPVLVEEIRRSLPELPAERARRFREELGLPAYDAEVLTASRELADFYERVAASAGDAKAASNWTMTEVLAWLKEKGARPSDLPVPPELVGELIGLAAGGTLSLALARRVFARMIETGESPAAIVEAEGLAQVRDRERILAWAGEVAAEHPEEARRYGEGERKLLGFFMGRLMEKSGGMADPGLASETLRELLER